MSFCPLFDSQLVSLAAPMYTLAKESFSLVGCHMLDLFAYKHLCADGVHRIQWTPFVKPTFRHVPLTSDSCHSSACHRSWSLGEMARLHARSFYARHFEQFRAMKIERFAAFWLDPEVLSAGRSWSPKLPVLAISGTTLEEHGRHDRIIRIVLPFSKRWQGLNAKLQSLHAAWNATLVRVGLKCRVQVSFARGSKPLWALVRSP